MTTEFKASTGALQSFAKFCDTCIELGELNFAPGEGPDLFMEQIDKNNILYVEAQITDPFIQNFSADEGVRIGVDWSRMVEILDAARDNEVNVEFNEEETRLVFSGDSGFNFDQSLVGLGGIPDGDFPDLQFDVGVRTTIGDLKDSVATCDLIDDSVNFEVRDGRLDAWTSGDKDRATDPVADVADGTPEAFTKFGTSTIQKITKGLPKDASVTFKMIHRPEEDKNYPAVLETNPWEGIGLKIGIAPRQG